jgi:adenylate cyclase
MAKYIMSNQLVNAEATFADLIRNYKYHEAEIFINSVIDSVNWSELSSDVYCTFLLFLYEATYKQSYYSKSSQVVEKLYALHEKNDNLSIRNIGKIHLSIAQTKVATMDLHDVENHIQCAMEIFEFESDTVHVAHTQFVQGSLLKMKGDYESALSQFQEALQKLEDTNESTLLGNGHIFLGMLHFDRSKFDLAFSMYLKAISYYECDNNPYGKSAALINMGNIYRRLSDTDKALDYYKRSLELNQQLGRKSGIANVHASMGNIYFNLQDFEKAALNYKLSIDMFEELGNKSALYLIYNNVGSTYLMLQKYDEAKAYYQRAFEHYRNTKNASEEMQYYSNMGHLYLQQKQLDLAIEFNERGLALSRESNDSDRIHEFMGSLGSIYFEESVPARDDDISFVYVNQAYEYAVQSNMKFEQATNAQRLSKMYATVQDWKSAYTYQMIFHDLESEIHSADIRKQAEIMEHNRKILEAEQQQKSELSALRAQSKLLHDILPSTIAERIISGEKTIAEETASVSIFFSDIVGFTTIAESISPSSLVKNLNELFSIVDNIADKHGIEKIKTIGDSYMAVCGIPEHKNDHAIRMAMFAKEVMSIAESFRFEDRKIELRIGIHSGPAVAGVIGLNRYSYDLWGDSVNIASRLESTGMPGKIQVSESFVLELSNQTNGEFVTAFRGETEMKGKGTMKTYILL